MSDGICGRFDSNHRHSVLNFVEGGANETAGRLVRALTLTSVSAAAQVTTSQYDNMRTGATLNEKILTPGNVNVQQFGKLGVFKVDGAVYAQPLFCSRCRNSGERGAQCALCCDRTRQRLRL
jgi:hypothetical protein